MTLSKSLVSAKASASEYCLAVRGNGELVSAHWGGIAKLVRVRGRAANGDYVAKLR